MGLEILCHGNHLLFQAPSITADGLLSVRLSTALQKGPNLFQAGCAEPAACLNPTL
jgi:hypothetical protein